MAHLFCSGDFVTVVDVGGEKVLKVKPAALTLLAEQAFIDVAHLLRPAHLQVMLQVCYKMWRLKLLLGRIFKLTFQTNVLNSC